MRRQIVRALLLLTALLVAPPLGGCTTVTPLPTVEHVDLERFMGDWYVIAHVPASIEKDACNAVESYRLEDDGTIATTYAFDRGAPGGPRKTYRPRGFVHDRATNAEWRMQFVWPFKAEYLIAYLDDDYTRTIIARTKRDLGWIMARTPDVDPSERDALVARLVAMGYDPADVRIVPHDRAGGGAPSPGDASRPAR